MHEISGNASANFEMFALGVKNTSCAFGYFE